MAKDSFPCLGCGQQTDSSGKSRRWRRFCTFACYVLTKGTYLVTCEICGRTTRAFNANQRVCSMDCRGRLFSADGNPNSKHGTATQLITCPRCGKQKEVPTRFHQVFCSKWCATRTGPSHPSWKGGVTPYASAVHCADGTQIRPHIVIAETALGHSLPPEAIVHHHDGNRKNNTNSNLVICQDQAYHLLLHRRQRVIHRGGNPDIEKFCPRCHTVKPKSAFARNRCCHDGLMPECKTCYSDNRRRCRHDNRAQVEGVLVMLLHTLESFRRRSA
jgi:hypothetical protein